MKRRLIAGVAGLVVGLTGCAIVPPGTVVTGSPSPSPSPSPTAPSTPAPSPSEPSPSPSLPTATATATPTPTPTGGATATPTTGTAVTATGSLLTFSNLVSDQLTGTCRIRKQAPTLTLSDAKNDFYGTVDVVVALTTGRDAVTSLRADFGEDFEGTPRKLVHPDTGTSAKVSIKGSTYTVTGKALMYEGSSKKGSLVPITLTVACAGDW